MQSAEGYERRHPHRLRPEDYRVVGQAVGFIVCARRRRSMLTAGGAPGLIAEALEFNASNNGVALIARCTMPDHLHIIAQVAHDGGDLLRFIYAFKKRTGSTLRGAGVGGPPWLRSFWDRHLRPEEGLSDLVSYVVHNPVRAGLCGFWYEWPHTWLDEHPRRYGLAMRVAGT